MERLRCGAHPGNDLVLVEDRTASRHHFEVQYTERGYLLVDLNSTNGTFLDGRRIERAYLSPGSQIRAGSSVITFSKKPAGRVPVEHEENEMGEKREVVRSS